LPHWRLPDGVTKGLWDYFQSPHIARDYDDYFRGNSLFDFDEAVLLRHFTRPGLVVDLGCGTGRLLVPLARRGFSGLAIDLSAHMLGVVGEKAAAEGLPIERLLANIVELDCLRDQVAEYCICMFSTLGMVRGHANRLRVLGHVRRLLKPGGRFVLHVHNRWYNLFSAEGRHWLLATLFGWVVGRGVEPGDKFFSYRGIPQMYLHVFTRRELRQILRSAGLRVVEFIPLNTQRRHRLRCAWWLGRLRANGWIVVCEPSPDC
jgi:SAM-dependent methyltransferase